MGFYTDLQNSPIPTGSEEGYYRSGRMSVDSRFKYEGNKIREERESSIAKSLIECEKENLSYLYQKVNNVVISPWAKEREYFNNLDQQIHVVKPLQDNFDDPIYLLATKKSNYFLLK